MPVRALLQVSHVLLQHALLLLLLLCCGEQGLHRCKCDMCVQ
jgi:hypothetical protein